MGTESDSCVMKKCVKKKKKKERNLENRFKNGFRSCVCVTLAIIAAVKVYLRSARSSGSIHTFLFHNVRRVLVVSRIR